MKTELSLEIFEKYPCDKFNEIVLVGAVLFHVETGQTDKHKKRQI